MRILIALLLLSEISYGADTISAFGHQWDVFNSSDWKIETLEGSQTLELLQPREPLPGPRRPMQFAVARTRDFSQVEVTAEVRPRGRSLVIVFAYRDPAHFNYAHLSTDTAVKQPFHNGVFHVFGGERVRISSQSGPAAFPANDRWYPVVLRFNGTTGTVRVSVDGHEVPALHAVDLSLTSGRIGLGSFDEVGDFRNLKITEPAPRR